MAYGFNLRRARTLNRIADRDSGERRNRSGAEYAETLATTPGIVRFINAAGETIPAYAVMRVTTPTTVDGEMIVNVAKPDATYRWRYLINGPEEVAAANGSPGWGTYIFNGDRVLYDTSVTTPAFGEEWGPKSGEWKLFQNRPGFIIDGRFNATDGWLMAMQVVPAEVRVKNDTGSDKAPASSATYSLFRGTTDLGLDVPSTTNDMSIDFKSNKYGSVGRIYGENYVVAWQT